MALSLENSVRLSREEQDFLLKSGLINYSTIDGDSSIGGMGQELEFIEAGFGEKIEDGKVVLRFHLKPPTENPCHLDLYFTYEALAGIDGMIDLKAEPAGADMACSSCFIDWKTDRYDKDPPIKKVRIAGLIRKWDRVADQAMPPAPGMVPLVPAQPFTSAASLVASLSLPFDVDSPGQAAVRKGLEAAWQLKKGQADHWELSWFHALKWELSLEQAIARKEVEPRWALKLLAAIAAVPDNQFASMDREARREMVSLDHRLMREQLRPEVALALAPAPEVSGVQVAAPASLAPVVVEVSSADQCWIIPTSCNKVAIGGGVTAGLALAATLLGVFLSGGGARGTPGPMRDPDGNHTGTTTIGE